MIGSAMTSILAFLLVLGVIVVLHELGHFLVAKLFRIRVETFSVGFGPRLFGFTRGETDYRVSLLPLGGYVKMAGENPTDEVTGAPHEFLSKPKWQRFLVAGAGPAMNIVLSVGLLWGLYIYGSEVPEFLQNAATVGFVEVSSPAAQAGIRAGDRIVAIDGMPEPNWQEVDARIITSPRRAIPIVVDRGGQRIEAALTPVPRGRSEMGYSGMGPLIRVVVQRVHPGSPAEKAGLLSGDEILTVNGIDLRMSGRSIQETIQGIPDASFPLTVMRAGQIVETIVSPMVQNNRKVIGIDIPPPMVMIKLGPADALVRSVQTNVASATLIFEVLGKLFKGEASLKSLDGPIGIARVSGQAADAGFTTLITLMALISLNLGMLNLLPIPILDGGVMLMLMVESVMRRDLSLRVKERIVQVSFIFLLALTVFVIYNDIVKLLPTQPAP